jgi:NADH dehydrogenase/NADH:ubiquinone oxidoreductase subunit G
MSSIIDTPETTPSAPKTGGGLSSALGVAGAALAVVALIVAAYLLVALRDARREIGSLQAQVRELAATADKRTRELDLGLAAVRGQAATVAERAGVTEAELEKTAATARQLREEQRKGQEHIADLGGEVGKVKEDVAASRAAIEQTQAQLNRAIGDLGEQSGLIARNAEELAALKRTGLREYYEFDLRKAKAPAAVGPVAIQLKDADAKRHKFNMVLVVDDLAIEKKDKTLLEPVQFYRKGSRQLNEIVVYAVQKDRITGYLSAPKAADAAAAN